jgi:hypothetical protein
MFIILPGSGAIVKRGKEVGLHIMKRTFWSKYLYRVMEIYRSTRCPFRGEQEDGRRYICGRIVKKPGEWTGNSGNSACDPVLKSLAACRV